MCVYIYIYSYNVYITLFTVNTMYVLGVQFRRLAGLAFTREFKDVVFEDVVFDNTSL